MLNIHLIIFLKSSSVSIFFHLLHSARASSSSPLLPLRPPPPQTNTQIYPIPKRGQGKTEPLENAIFLFLISRSIRSGQRWVPWQYVYLYIL